MEMFMILRKKSKKEDTIDKHNDLIQFWKDEKMSSRIIEEPLAASSKKFF